MNVNLRLGFVLALALALSVAGCGDSESSGAGELPARPADVRGTVTSVQQAQNGAVTVMIDRGEACMLSTQLPADVRVFSETDQGRADRTIDDVAVSQKVDAWVGPIAESCPEQTTAEAVVILAGP